MGNLRAGELEIVEIRDVSPRPTVAQWARAQAMHGVTRIVTGSRVIISDQDARRLEKITENWARYIETGKWDAEQ